MNGLRVQRAFLPLLGLALAWAQVASGSGVQMSISASDTSSSANTAPPAGGIRYLFLWLVCEDPGISALEMTVAGSLPNLGFTTLNGAINIGDASHLLLALPGCQSGLDSLVVGKWTVWDTGGTFCPLDGSEATYVAVECPVFGADPIPNPRSTGFDSNGAAACRVGDNGCVILSIGTEPFSWGRTKSVYR